MSRAGRGWPMGGPGPEWAGPARDGSLGDENSQGSHVSRRASEAWTSRCLWGDGGRCPFLTLPLPAPGTTLRTLVGCRALGLSRWRLCSPSSWRAWP